jgi:hypothetical protein
MDRTYWHIIVNPSREHVRGTILVQMLVHAVTAKGAIALTWN